MKDNKPTENKKLLRLQDQLHSPLEEVVEKALDECRNYGRHELIPTLSRLYLDPLSKGIKDKAYSILTDLNDQEGVPELVRMLKENRKNPEIKNLVSACWQNGLDYSVYLEFFVDLVIEGDYETGIEAFTVIEENILNLRNDRRNQLANKLKKEIPASEKSRKPLLEELHSVISIVRPDGLKMDNKDES